MPLSETSATSAWQSIVIADASVTDMQQVQQIYAQHVLYGLATFETEPPDLAEMLSRRENILSKGLPYLVAKSGEQVLGYCYLSPYRPRYAYRFTAEDSVYLDPAAQGKGVGKRLLSEAIERATIGGWRQIISIIGNSENIASQRLHESLGFTLIGQLTAVGFKHGRWVNTLMMQRALGEGNNTLPDNCEN